MFEMSILKMRIYIKEKASVVHGDYFCLEVHALINCGRVRNISGDVTSQVRATSRMELLPCRFFGTLMNFLMAFELNPR